MRSRVLILVSLVVLAAIALVVGVAVAGAGQTDPLPPITAPDLLAKMAQTKDVTAVSGDVSWHNGLFGDLGSVAGSGMAQAPAQSPLTSDGSGRIWVSDAGAKVESQGSGGDQVVVVDKAARTAWVYDYANNTVKKFDVTGTAPAETASPAPSATMVTPQAITAYLQQVARFATVEVAGQAKVAGQDTYLLRMTPVAKDTALGYVQAAIDGKTMVPLQVEVYAKGATTPVIKFGFSSVSYGSIDPSTFAFTPPAGTKVTTKTVDGNALKAKADKMHQAQSAKGEPTQAQKQAAQQAVQGALLTRDQVAKLVPYQLAFARGYTARPYQWGYVLGNGGPLTSSGATLMKALGAATGMGLGMGQQPSLPSASKTATMGPSSVLLYGQGFGTIVLAQTQTTPDLAKQLKQLQQTSQILGTTTIGTAKATEVGTPLGGVVVWQQGGTTLVAGGMVPMSDLEAFASSVR
jgi:outer membrane lipoprotein-sorting protein